jgi:hypothetical protein
LEDLKRKFYDATGREIHVMPESILEHGSHPLGHEPYRQNGFLAALPLVGIFSI